MDEKRIVLASLLLAFFGLALIAISTKAMEAREVEIPEVGAYVGEYVQIDGYVSKVSSSNGNVFITLCKKGCVAVVIFRSVAGRMDDPNPYLVKKGERLFVRGGAQLYKGSPEVVVLREDGLGEG